MWLFCVLDAQNQNNTLANRSRPIREGYSDQDSKEGRSGHPVPRQQDLAADGREGDGAVMLISECATELAR